MWGSRYLLLAALVALAGCAGALGGDQGGTATPIETPTETAAPTATPTPTAQTPTTTATATPSAPQIDPETEQRYRALNRRIDEKTVSLLDSEIVNETTVSYTIDQNTNRTLDQMFRGEAMPVPQAIALEMAEMENPPERAVFSIVNDRNERIFQNSFGIETARAYENRSIQANEFSDMLSEEATTQNGGKLRHPTTLFSWETGDRARYSYVEGIKRAARDSRFKNKLNITDSGLHNDSHYFSQDDINIENNSSIYITLQHPRDGGNESHGYEFFSEDIRAASLGVILEKYGEASYYRPFGNPPGGLQIRFIDTTGELYKTHVIADNHGYAYEDGQIGAITLIKKMKTTYHNGGTERHMRAN